MTLIVCFKFIKVQMYSGKLGSYRYVTCNMCTKCGFYASLYRKGLQLYIRYYITCTCVKRHKSYHGELVGLRDDSRQSRVPRKPSDWRGASESSAGQNGFYQPRGSRSWRVDFRESGRILAILKRL